MVITSISVPGCVKMIFVVYCDSGCSTSSSNLKPYCTKDFQREDSSGKADEKYPDDKDFRIYSLKNDLSHNFLAAYYVSGIMEQIFYYRAVDTRGKNYKEITL